MVKLEMSKWLKPTDFEENEIAVVIAGEGEVRKAEDNPFGRDMFELPITMSDGETKIWTMNMTSQRTLITEFGPETKDWVNKKIVIFKTKQSVRGEVKDVLYARVAKKKVKKEKLDDVEPVGKWKEVPEE